MDPNSVCLVVKKLKRKGEFEPYGTGSDSDEPCFKSRQKQQIPRKRVSRKWSAPRLTPVLYQAKIKELANTDPSEASLFTNNVPNKVMGRIAKCLDRGHHHSAAESESKAAPSLASRTMAQYNVTQEQVLAYNLVTSQKYYPGQSVVSITRRDQDRFKSIKFQGYLEILCEAMQCFFGCKYYSTSNLWSLDFTFYGIAQNTVAAARALEMAYNTITEWARPYRGTGPKNSYALGASDGLMHSAQREKAMEEAQAKASESAKFKAKLRQEIAERQAKLARLDSLSTTAPSVYPDSSSEAGSSSDVECDEDNEYYLDPDFDVEDDEMADPFEDLDTLLERLMRNKYGFGGSSSRSSASVLLRTQRRISDQIADNYLISNNISPTKRRARGTPRICDPSAYKQGEKDSRKIDVRKNRLG